MYARAIMRNSQRMQKTQLETRQSQLFMQLFQYHISKDRWKDAWALMTMEWDDFDDFARKYDSTVNIENFAIRFNQWYFFDGMGLLLKKNLVDREMIFYLMGGGFGVLLQWDMFESIIKDMRVRLNRSDLFVWFEYLAEELKKTAEEKGVPWMPPENLSFTREEI